MKSILSEHWGAWRRWGVVAILAVLSGVLPLGGLPWQSAAHAAKLEGQRFDDAIALSDRTLRLNGLGLRGVAWIKAFVAGLYLTAPTRDAAQAMVMPGPKRLRLKIMMEAPGSEFSKAFAKGVRKNESDKVQAQLAARMTVFISTVDAMGTIRKGDVIDIDYLPGSGTQLRLNNKAMGPMLAGDDFYRALLKIFIGEKPVDARMKEGLLRGGSTP